MKIAIDVGQIIYGTGVSVYTENLVKNLLKVDQENNYVLFGGSLRRFRELKQKTGQFRSLVYGTKTEMRIFPYPPTLADFVWNRLHVFPVGKLIGKMDVLHTSDWSEPPSKAFKVTTIHDLIPLKYPRMIHPKIVEAYQRRFYWVRKEADKIIVPSTSTKKDLMDFGVDGEKIRVVFEANTIERAANEDVVKVKRKFGISGNYLLAIASSFYKNTENVIKAFDLSSAGRNLKLVIIGRQSNTNIKERRGIQLTGFVSKEEYAALCTGAKGLIFPSLYEGFGIAILDAFACGTPVVASNTSSMPEVAGSAAVLVNPDDPSSISEGIEKILGGPKGLIEKGLARIKDFSWEKCARETLEVYKEANSKL